MRHTSWKHIFRESGLCLDRPRLLDTIALRPWLRVLAFRFLRLRFSPAILENAEAQPGGTEERGRLYSLAMSHLNVGDTYKTTGRNRTVLADAALGRLAAGYSTPSALEVGVSDGISALGLLRNSALGAITLTDRFPLFHEKPIPLGRVFLNADGRLLGIKFLCFYLNIGEGPLCDLTRYTPIETANPVVRQEFGIQAIQRFDMFHDRLDKPVDLIKCANILNTDYFPDRAIRRAVANLGRNLTKSGHLVISQNNARYPKGEALFILRREDNRLVPAGEENDHDVASLFSEGLSLENDRPPEPLRVFFLIPSLEFGGAERQLVLLANGLAARGHRVAVALHHADGPLENTLAVDVERIQLRKRSRWDFGGFIVRSLRAVQRFEPDIVCPFLGTPNILTGLLKPFLRPARLLWSVRASSMTLDSYDRTTRLAYWLEARLSPLANVIVANSEAGREHAHRRGFPARNMTVIPNGIDMDHFRPDRDLGLPLRVEWGLEPNDILVGLVARLDPMKDHTTFLRAAALAAKHDGRMRFVCVGSGPLEARLRALSASLRLNDRLVWAGERNDMSKVYNAMDILCLASAFGEGFPNVLGEAMACGVPCVTTDVGDARLVVGDTGIVVQSKDSDALADALLTMAERAPKGDVPAPRSRIEQNFSCRTMVDRYETLLLRTIE